MRPVKKCIVCHVRPAQVPDRNKPGRPIKAVCWECHAERLVGDVVEVLKASDRIQ